jgi:hypothetical protein
MRYNAINIKYNQANVKYNGTIISVGIDYSNLTTTSVQVIDIVSTGIISLSFPTSEIFAATTISNISNINMAEVSISENEISGLTSFEVLDTAEDDSEIKVINISTMGTL